MTTTLYELNDIYLNLLDLIEAGADDEDVQKALENIQDEIENKADGYAIVIKSLEAQNQMFKEEEKRLYSKRKTNEKNIVRMKRNLEETMYLQDKKKFKTDKFSFNIQKNRATVKIVDEDKIPEEFKEEVITMNVDKKALLEALKDGELIDGAEYVQTESLRIR